MYGWNGAAGSGSNSMHIMGQGGMGKGIGGGRVMGPMRQAFRQQYAGQPNGVMKQAMQGYRSSAPYQSWMGQAPQRPEGGWSDPAARQTAFSGWYNQQPNYPWGAEPADWQASHAQGTPPAGTDVPQQGGGQQWGNVLAQMQSDPRFANSGFGKFVNGMGHLGQLFHGNGNGHPNWLAMLQNGSQG